MAGAEAQPEGAHAVGRRMMTNEEPEVKDALAALAQTRVMVVGDLMIDRYQWGAVERISPEAPVPVVKVLSTEDRLGGAANVVSNLLALGCQVATYGVVGHDESGTRLRELLLQRGAQVDGIVTDPERPTTEKLRVMAQHQQMIRCDRERTDPIGGAVVEQMVSAIEARLDDFGGIIVSDYGKGLVTPALLTKLIRLCARQEKAIVIDPKGQDYSKYRGATSITPNEHEAAMAARVPITTVGDATKVARDMLLDLKLEHMCITMGARGVLAVDADGQFRHFPAAGQEVFDVTGAGDTFISTYGGLLIAARPFFECVEAANLAAGLAVGKLGTAVVTAAELLRAAEGSDALYSVEDMAALAEQLRKAGKRIVFTNGCFDLLHAGHIQYLQASRNRGDVLIVGINSDDSVHRLKGEGRPVIGEADRAHLLTALSAVDYVVIFEEDTPLELIRAIRPDVLTKGADYTVDTVVGHELLADWGGTVELLPLKEDRSTSDIINRIVAGRGG